MAIAFDASSSGGTSSGTSATFSHTCSGSNLVLFVCVTIDSGKTPTVTYNGVSMTQVQANVTIPTTGADVALFRLLNPATGANTVSISNGTTFITGASASYTGVGSIDNSGTNTNAGTTSYATSLTPVADSCWVLEGVSENGHTTTAGAGTTKRVQETVLNLASIYDNAAAVSPPASTTLNVNSDGSSRPFASIIASIAPPSTATFLSRRLRMGVG